MQFQKVVDDLELLIREDLVEHEEIRSYGCDPEDNFIINPRDVVQNAIEFLKEYDIALRMMVYQYCTIEKQFLEGKDCDQPEQEIFFHRYMSAGEQAFRVLGIENGQEVKDEFIWS